ncbi:MAG: GntR family transcriptional regulator [Cytophagales bacterium]|nr:MAG: GntR family transcriptional regulator [Cytophagales bacterium]
MKGDFLYQRVYKDLKNSILNGKYKTDSKLPSENELCESYQTTRLTIRQAFEELRKEGFIYKIHGKGTFVKAEKRSLGLLSFKGFSEVVGEGHLVQTRILQKPVCKSFPLIFFEELSETEQEVGCIYLERLRFADQTPVMLEQTYLPNLELSVNTKTTAKLSSICDAPLVNDSLFKTLQIQFEIEVVGLEQAIRAVESEKYIAEMLRIVTKSPILHINRRYITNKSNFFIYSTLYCNTDKYAMSNNF